MEVRLSHIGQIRTIQTARIFSFFIPVNPCLDLLLYSKFFTHTVKCGYYYTIMLAIHNFIN